MATSLGFLSLLVLVTSTGCEDAASAQENVSPITNVTLDPRKKMLAWACRRTVSQQECTIDTPPDYSAWQTPQVSADGTYFCVFPNAVLHRGANLTVNATANGDAFKHELAFENAGPEGSAAVGFSCLIYSLHFMNCSWEPGPAAPADVRYRLFTWTDPREDEVECPYYVVDADGVRVGCHFDKLAPPNQTDYFFLVNGTSEQTAVQFVDFKPLQAMRMEKYGPPANITIQYNGSCHLIQWDNPETRFEIASHMLCYELEIQSEGSSARRDRVSQRGDDRNAYVVPGPAAGAQSTFRARVKHKYGRPGTWSTWSPTLRFGVPEQGFGGPGVVQASLAVSFAALLTTALMLLCARFSLRRKLFPPVPQVKTELGGSLMPGLQVSWDKDSLPPGWEESEDILTVEDTPSGARGQAEPERPASAVDDPENTGPERRACEEKEVPA
ncbi:granulocyte-macrophage colony-stimulating factor receptor subunit alpha-like [Rousettus aegyptiacus]|uniref:Colony stimulating factor 2 receptor subunit alpha n=1 Tax=Rousettus aegyptiacus TaxID=9407 RepID=A0A7J8B7J0_ROUAE|nr:granulocyte-macrophage colony-stimulating factor receptor subunit alpha-like [Rousettus aegyptiacus]KAF6394668.1 colony stimulating factor 2 receptor subunit alpha [Rousettus aegyptiacus]